MNVPMHRTIEDLTIEVGKSKDLSPSRLETSILSSSPCEVSKSKEDETTADGSYLICPDYWTRESTRGERGPKRRIKYRFKQQ